VNVAFKLADLSELNFCSGKTCTIFKIFRSLKIEKINLMLFQNYTYSALEIRRNDLVFYWECGVEV
jgi:hypothetical protein